MKNNSIKTGPGHVNPIAVKILNRLKLGVINSESVLKKVIFFSALTWLPLFIITLIQNNAINPDITMPFLKDYESYGRFLISIPAIFIAEKFINLQTSGSLVHFVESGIISENNVGEYELLLNKYRKLSDSKSLQVVIFIISTLNIFLVKTFWGSLMDFTSWKYDAVNDSITAAGYWYMIISLPVLKYLIFRLFCRFLLWSWFLWKISNMNLNLIAIDPDRSGGLGFLGIVQSSFGFLGFAQAAIASSEVANQVIYSGVPIEDYRFSLLVIPIVVIVYLSPLFYFSRKLGKLKLDGIMIYSTLTHKYSKLFEDKWIRGNNINDNESILGSGDIQSLADIGATYEVVENIRVFPINLNIFLFMLIMVTIPFIPLLFLKFNIKQILEGLAGFLL